ncbi:2-amino-4-hydroxy-6-hydroxymethyldihydropteridinediphosphokinase [Primorskyibacter flagellatus]|uniref:2-amino-4-hydroxy-6-hydroxymethyldihydropteridine pyrophosphokinase n=1 Tax=Primorskyibacter flagellatus TaxID=1387277 RepID=A0A1W1ZU40_9RHOB|nr:2-amino-4-hydroxy-6-hydroxymethyldihydropteridinediphosphokinase [Primorskyibacter flagellatus]
MLQARRPDVKNSKIYETDQELLIAVGSNLGSQYGNATETVAASVNAIANSGRQIRAISRFYATPCFPKGAGPDYVNAALVLRAAGKSISGELHNLHAIEAEFGRSRKTRWGMRTLDLDLLAAGAIIRPNRATFDQWRNLDEAAQRRDAPDTLILPHPRLQDRAFVLVPLCDVAPDWRHPVLGRSVAELCADLPENMRREVVAL